MSTNNNQSFASRKPLSVLLVIGAVPGNASYRADIERLKHTMSMDNNVRTRWAGDPDEGCNTITIRDAMRRLQPTNGKVTTIICSLGHTRKGLHQLQLGGPGGPEDVEGLTHKILFDITSCVGEERMMDVGLVSPAGSMAAVVRAKCSLPEGFVVGSLIANDDMTFLDRVHCLSEHAGKSDWNVSGVFEVLAAHRPDVATESLIRTSDGFLFQSTACRRRMGPHAFGVSLALIIIPPSVTRQSRTRRTLKSTQENRHDSAPDMCQSCFRLGLEMKAATPSAPCTR